MKRTSRLILLIYLLIHSLVIEASLPHSRCLIWSFDNEDNFTEGQKQALLKRADESIRTKDVSVVQKQRSITGDIHEYESMAIYAWRNPDDPQGPYIIRDCERNPESDLYCVRLMYTFSDRLTLFGKAYYLSGEKKYSDACIRQLKTWCIDSETYMTPRFKYGQFIPGKNNGLGYPGAVSEAYYLVNALECISLLKENGALDRSTDKKLKAWFRKLANWMYNTEQGQSWGRVKDNLCIMYDILLYRICIYTGQKSICKSIRNAFTTQRLNVHVASDGSQPQELLRPTAFSYSMYNIEHIIDFCSILEKTGVHYYSSHRERIDRALDFIEKHATLRDATPYQEPADKWDSLAQRVKIQRQRLQHLQYKR